MTASLFNSQNGPLGDVIDAYAYPQFLTAFRAPTSQDIYNPGTRWLFVDQTNSTRNIYETSGAGDWDTGGVQPATTTTYGTVILTDNNEPVATKFYADNLAIAGAPAWSETVSGIGQLSTTLEATTGTDDNTAMTPLKVAQVLAGGGSSPSFTNVTITGTLDVGGLTTLSASAVIDTAGTALDLATDADTADVNIGTGAAARTITIGNVTAGTAVAVNTGTGSFTVTTTGTGDIVLNSDDTMLLDADGVLELNSSAGIIGIGNDADANNINIGTGAAQRVITIGNGTSASQVVLNAGTAGINIGTNAIAHSVTIGNQTGATAVVIDAGTGGIDIGTTIAKTITIGNITTTTAIAINSGTGGIALASTSTGDITLNSSDTLLLDSAGVLELNSSAGIISIGNDAVSQNINIGGAGTRAITLGNSTSTTSVSINTGTGSSLNLGTNAIAHVVTIGNVTGATGVTINSGTAGVAINTTGAGDFVVTSADTVLIDSAGVLELNSSAGVIGIGNDAVAQNINIGTGAAARVITIGNVSGASQVVINSGTAGVAINTTGAGDVLINSADTVLIDSAGVLELNSSAGAISIGNDAVAQNINVGTGAAARVITIGNVTGATGVAVNTGTGHFTVTTTGTGDIILDSDDTMLLDADGVLELNSSAGNISVGNDAVAQTANFNTGAAAKVTNIGSTNTTSSTVINAGSGLITMAGKVALNSSAGPQVLAGAGDPNAIVTAPQGSLWLRTDGSSTSTRAYINTNAGTAWTAITTAS